MARQCAHGLGPTATKISSNSFSKIKIQMPTNAAKVTNIIEKPAGACDGNVMYKINIIIKKINPILHADVVGEIDRLTYYLSLSILWLECH